MKLLCQLDQKAAILRGCDAPDSTVPLEITPSDFTPDEREILSARFEKGVLRHYSSDKPYQIPALTMPTVAGLKEALAACLPGLEKGRRDKEDAELKRAADEAAENAQREAAFAALMNGAARFRDEKADGTYGNEWGDTSAYDDCVFVHAPGIGANLRLDRVPIMEPIIAAYLARKAAYFTARKTEQEAEAARAKAEREAQIAARQAQIDAKAREIGGVFLERHLAGYTVEEEIIAAIQRDELAARGLANGEDKMGRDRIQKWERPLSDAQFLALRDFLKLLPEGAKHVLQNAWNTVTEEDDDGEETTRIEDDILYVKATWTVGFVTVTARQVLGPVPIVETLD